MTKLDTDTARILSRLAELNAQIEELNGEAEGLKAELRTLPPGDYDLDGRRALSIIPTRRFDAAGAASLLEPDVRQTCLSVTYDAAKVKAHLTPVQVEAHMVISGKPKVVLP